MFRLIRVGDTAVVDDCQYPVVRVSSSRFWLEIDGTPVKFTKKNGIEYGAERRRLAQPVDEVSAQERRYLERQVAIGDLPESEFSWLLAVDSCLGPERSVMDALKEGWEWRRLFDDYPEAPYMGALSAATYVM